MLIFWPYTRISFSSVLPYLSILIWVIFFGAISSTISWVHHVLNVKVDLLNFARVRYANTVTSQLPHSLEKVVPILVLSTLKMTPFLWQNTDFSAQNNLLFRNEILIFQSKMNPLCSKTDFSVQMNPFLNGKTLDIKIKPIFLQIHGGEYQNTTFSRKIRILDFLKKNTPSFENFRTSMIEGAGGYLWMFYMHGRVSTHSQALKCAVLCWKDMYQPHWLQQKFQNFVQHFSGKFNFDSSDETAEPMLSKLH